MYNVPYVLDIIFDGLLATIYHSIFNANKPVFDEIFDGIFYNRNEINYCIKLNRTQLIIV